MASPIWVTPEKPLPFPTHQALLSAQVSDLQPNRVAMTFALRVTEVELNAVVALVVQELERRRGR